MEADNHNMCRFKIEKAEDNTEAETIVCDNFKFARETQQGATDLLKPCWRELVISFLRQARRECDGQTFVARDDESQRIVGSISCQRWRRPVPIEVLDPVVLSIGTMWGLHVQEGRRIVAKGLIQHALQYLKEELKCHKVVVQSHDATPFLDCGFAHKNMLTLSLSDSDYHMEGMGGSLTLLKSDKDDQIVQISKEGQETDSAVVDHWRKMWREVGIPEEGLVNEMEKVTLDFIKNAREHLHYQTVVAQYNDKIVGSVSCQVWEGPCPQVTKSQTTGTIWAVYVDPAFRRQGIATALMKEALRHLMQIGCDTAILIAASEGGQRVYERLGFAPNNALVWDLPSDEVTPSDKASHECNLMDDLRKHLEVAGVRNLQQGVVQALVTATTQQIAAVFDDHPQRQAIIKTIVEFQSEHGLYVDPKENWFTQNVKRFGRGFDMKDLSNNEDALASKFDRLSRHYDHWTIGNQSKVETFIVKCFKDRLQNVPANNRLLDVACGIGLQGQTLRLCGYQGEVVGTDVSPGMIARVQERGCYNHAYIANANSGLSLDSDPATDRDFDVVVCTGAMELLDQPTALQNISSVTKTGGELWVSFQYANGTSPTTHQNVCGVSREKAITHLKDAGFETLSVDICPNAFYTPSPKQDGSLLPVPYLFIVAKKVE